mgnify:CR=1 FL=1
MPVSEAWRDAPRSLRRAAYRGHFSDYLGGVLFVAGVAQSGMPEAMLARLRGNGIPLDDVGPWEDTPPAPVAADLAVLPSEPAPDDAPGVSAAHPAPPAPSASPVRIPYTPSPLPGERPATPQRPRR